jgi:hypothetical protein
VAFGPHRSLRVTADPVTTFKRSCQLFQSMRKTRAHKRRMKIARRSRYLLNGVAVTTAIVLVWLWGSTRTARSAAATPAGAPRAAAEATKRGFYRLPLFRS